MRNHTSCLLPSESFLGKDREKKKVCTSSSGEGESGCQWTDSATDHDTSSIDNVVEGSANNRMCSRRHPMHLTTKKREMQRRGIGMGISLTDEALADHDRSAHLSCQACPIGYGLVFPDCRPFVPRLQLEDAGLSYGPPNSICPSYTTLNSLTPSELEQLADLPVDYQHLMSRRAKLVSEGTEKENNQKSRRDSGKIKATKEKRNKKAQVADIPPLPSYSNVSHCIHKTTACFEARKRALKEHQEYRAKMLELEREPSPKAWIDTRKPKKEDNLILRNANSTSTSASRDHRLAFVDRRLCVSMCSVPSILQVVVLTDRY